MFYIFGVAYILNVVESILMIIRLLQFLQSFLFKQN